MSIIIHKYSHINYYYVGEKILVGYECIYVVCNINESHKTEWNFTTDLSYQ